MVGKKECDCTREEKVVPAIPQSEVLAKFFEEIGEILAKFFADFRPSISRENGRASTFFTVHQIKFFHCCNSGGLGAQEKERENIERRFMVQDVSFEADSRQNCEQCTAKEVQVADAISLDI